MRKFRIVKYILITAWFAGLSSMFLSSITKAEQDSFASESIVSESEPVKVATFTYDDRDDMRFTPDKDGVYEVRTNTQTGQSFSAHSDIDGLPEVKEIDDWVAGDGYLSQTIFLKQGVEYTFFIYLWENDIPYEIYFIRDLTQEDIFWANGSSINAGSSTSYYKYSAKAGHYTTNASDLIVMRASDFGIVSKGQKQFVLPIDTEVILYSESDYTLQKTADLKAFDWETDATVEGWYTYLVAKEQSLFLEDPDNDGRQFISVYDKNGDWMPTEDVRDGDFPVYRCITLPKGEYVFRVWDGTEQETYPIATMGNLQIGANVMERESLKTFTCARKDQGFYVTYSTEGKITVFAAEKDRWGDMQIKDLQTIGGLQFVELNEEDKFYATTVNRNNEGTAKLTFLKLQDSGQSLYTDGRQVNLSLPEREFCYYTMQSEGGIYSLDLENCKNTCLFWETGPDHMNYGRLITEDTKNITEYLPKGPVYWTIVTDDLSARQISIRAIKQTTFEELPEGREVTLQVSANSCIYRTFTPSNTLLYELWSKGDAEWNGLKFSFTDGGKRIFRYSDYIDYDEEEWLVDSIHVGCKGGWSDLVELKANQPCLLEIRNESDTTKKLSLYLGPVLYEVKENTINPEVIDQGHVYLYKPEKTGYLKYVSGDFGYKLINYSENLIYNISSSWLEQDNYFRPREKKVVVEKGKNYYFYGYEDGDYNSCISQGVFCIDEETYAIDQVIEKINAIGTVTAESEAAIRDARKAYDALGSEMQKKYASQLLEPLSKLNDAEKELILIKQQSGGTSQDPSSGQNTGTKTSDQPKEQGGGTKKTDPQAGQNPEKEVPAAQTGTKSANPMTVSGKKITVKHKDLKKKDGKFAANRFLKIQDAKGTVSYKFISVNRGGFKKFFKLNQKTGKLTIKKGINKGTYILKIKVKVSGNAKYTATSKTVKVKVKVQNLKSET